MKLLTFLDTEQRPRVGRLTPDGEIQPLSLADGRPATQMLALIDDPTALSGLAAVEPALPWERVQVLAPIPCPRRNLFCVGKNYRQHAEEFARSGFDSSGQSESTPTAPIVFSKVPQTVIGTGAAVWNTSGISDALDYEAELAVIIGHAGRGIRREDAMHHVWGYTIVNDVTARDWQKRHGQWHMGKSFDTFCPMGPVAVTADALDASSLDLKCWINGELRQHGNTADLIFDIPALIETISAGITLLPGDIIATGTPDGVGIGFDPPRFLHAGDTMTIEIEGIGRLQNRVGA